MIRIAVALPVTPKFNYLSSQCNHEGLVTEVKVGAAIGTTILVTSSFAKAAACRSLLKF
jgi:hypothetical protein